MPDLRSLFKISRPRFWLYIFGPYIVGLAAGVVRVEDLFCWDVLIFGLYFLFPANLLVYGINDVFDFDTDRRNPKKADYEILVPPASHRPLLRWIAFLNIPFIVAAYFLAPLALPSFAGFIFFSVFYSAPPIRAKAIPIVDSAFNVLYVFPGAFAYQMITGDFPSMIVFAAGWLWTMAMHAFSAIPDIDSDSKAKVCTIATFLGRTGTLGFCIAAYLGSALLALPFLGPIGIVIGLIYVAIMLFAIFSPNSETLFRIYRIFPFINAVVGFLIFWFIAGPKFLNWQLQTANY